MQHNYVKNPNMQEANQLACSRLSIGGSERKHRRVKKSKRVKARPGARGISRVFPSQTLLIFSSLALFSPHGPTD